MQPSFIYFALIMLVPLIGELRAQEESLNPSEKNLLLDAVRAEGFEVETVEHLPPVAYRSPRDAVGMRPMLYRPVRWMARKM